MGDFDPRSVSDAARNYRRLQHRSLLYTLGQFVPFVILVALLSTATEKTYPLTVACFLLFAPLAAFCTLAGFLTSLDARTFACPRCKERFDASWGRAWPVCKHCGLDLGPTATASKQLPSMRDPLE